MHAHAHVDRIAEVRTQLVRRLALVLADTPRVAMLDFPAYGNVGDSAIWLGALALLRQLGIAPPFWAAGRMVLHLADLRARIAPDDVLLLSGGGNFGDLWPAHQDFREEVLRAFPSHRVVQLPQSLHFDDPGALNRARHVVARHRRFTLIVRDEESLAFAREHFDCDVLLAPDLAYALGPLPRPRPTRPVVWLSRHDKERALGEEPPTRGVPREDWHADDGDHAALLHGWLLKQFDARPVSLRPFLAPFARTFPFAARRRLERGIRLLGAGETVVTDRLHGHVLSLLLGIPHVLLPSRTGKAHALHRTWTAGHPLVRFAETETEALREAAEMGEGGGGRDEGRGMRVRDEG
ncbi:MAG TPA: polysaccharide pyruvyl transferase family protein [Gemmatimonadaceae bacterium]|nr:polysaccharide pyruvyl transferase family protein [Gemmatimonadaceae bacterium]